MEKNLEFFKEVVAFLKKRQAEVCKEYENSTDKSRFERLVWLGDMKNGYKSEIYKVSQVMLFTTGKLHEYNTYELFTQNNYPLCLDLFRRTVSSGITEDMFDEMIAIFLHIEYEIITNAFLDNYTKVYFKENGGFYFQIISGHYSQYIEILNSNLPISCWIEEIIKTIPILLENKYIETIKLKHI